MDYIDLTEGKKENSSPINYKALAFIVQILYFSFQVTPARLFKIIQTGAPNRFNNRAALGKTKNITNQALVRKPKFLTTSCDWTNLSSNNWLLWSFRILFFLKCDICWNGAKQSHSDDVVSQMEPATWLRNHPYISL